MEPILALLALWWREPRITEFPLYREIYVHFYPLFDICIYIVYICGGK